MIIRQIKQRPVQQVSVDLEGIYAQQSLTRRAAERVAGWQFCGVRLRYWDDCGFNEGREGIEDGRAT